MSIAFAKTPMLLLAAVAALGAAVVANTSAFADTSSVAATAVVETASGADTYAHICQGCHMAAAQGAVGAGHYPKLAGDPALVSWQYVALTVLNGKNGMPALGTPQNEATEFGAVHLSDARIADVVNYVRTHFGNRWKDKVTAAQVAALPHPL